MSGFLSIYPLDVTEILTVRQLDILRIDPVSNLKDAREIVLDLSTECEEVLFAFDKLKLEGFLKLLGSVLFHGNQNHLYA